MENDTQHRETKKMYSVPDYISVISNDLQYLQQYKNLSFFFAIQYSGKKYPVA